MVHNRKKTTTYEKYHISKCHSRSGKYTLSRFLSTRPKRVAILNRRFNKGKRWIERDSEFVDLCMETVYDDSVYLHTTFIAYKFTKLKQILQQG